MYLIVRSIVIANCEVVFDIGEEVFVFWLIETSCCTFLLKFWLSVAFSDV